MDGPRAARPDEVDALRQLTDVVFRKGMPEQYPQLFNAENLENLRVCFDGPICTSHVGMVQREALLMGCRIRVCCIGAVSTHPDYRKQGLASACFDDAVKKAHADGVDVMIVSGGRGLYIRNGCLNLGRDYRVKVTADSFKPSSNQTIKLIPMPDSSRDIVAECHRREPVRFVRTPADYRFFKESGWAMNSPAEILMIYGKTRDTSEEPDREGPFLGYGVVRKPDAALAASLIEFGGDRHAVLAALPEIIDRQSLTSLSFQVMGSDPVMQTLCEREGFEMTPTSASGTIKLINFPQLMSRMRPRFNEILGNASADRLRFEQDGEQYIFACGDAHIALDRDTATRAVFGDLAGLPEEIANGPSEAHELRQLLSSILPLPTLWYGINYV